MTTAFDSNGWEDYLYWQKTDKKMLARVNQLIKDITRTPYEGLGKPEPLRHEMTGYWSRRINERHRLVYTVKNNTVIIVQCRYHY